MALFLGISMLVSGVARAQVCTFGAGALPVDTLPPGTPHGNQIPINHIVVFMQENRSFDHYFGHLYKKGQPAAEPQPAGASNPDPLSGAPIEAFHQRRACEFADLNHSWNGTHREWNNGAMDGFTAQNVNAADPSGQRTMGYYSASNLGFYYKLYRTFAMGDRYFCSLLSQTFPNRFYLVAGSSFGHIRNDLPTVATDFDQPTIFKLLDDAGVSWKIYAAQISENLVFAYVRNHVPSMIAPIADYYTNAAAGTLPQVSFIEPVYLGNVNSESDEHPPANVQVGQAFAAQVITALLSSPLWTQSALFHMYDEHGGFYDHVPPPPACVPDAIPPMLQPNDVLGAFDRYGIRVPAVVVSPYAKRRFVSHVVNDHTSVLRFIETRFDLPALTVRDANANPMLEFFDFQNPRFMTPPRLPKARISKAKTALCAKEHP